MEVTGAISEGHVGRVVAMLKFQTKFEKVKKSRAGFSPQGGTPAGSIASAINNQFIPVCWVRSQFLTLSFCQLLVAWEE